MNNQKKLGAISFLPLLVFLLLYVGCGVTFTVLGYESPFSYFPRHVALLAGIGVVNSGVFQALGQGIYSLLVSLIRQLVVLIPCAYAIGRLTGDVTMVWYAFVVAEVVSLALSVFFFIRVHRRVIRTLRPAD